MVDNGKNKDFSHKDIKLKNGVAFSQGAEQIVNLLICRWGLADAERISRKAHEQLVAKHKAMKEKYGDML